MADANPMVATRLGGDHRRLVGSLAITQTVGYGVLSYLHWPARSSQSPLAIRAIQIATEVAVEVAADLTEQSPSTSTSP